MGHDDWLTGGSLADLMARMGHDPSPDRFDLPASITRC